MTSATTLEHLSVELLDEIIIYFQYHEAFNIFSNLNSRFAAIISNMSLMPVYLGLNGMSIALTKFYYTHLSQPNICNRLISLCVSDTIAIDNGLWLASRVSTFINLRHLSLIDIKRSSFELILNAFLPNTSLAMFSVCFSTYYRAVYTFEGLPEGTYYGQIFRLFPSLRACHLRFWRYIRNTLDSQQVLPFGRTFLHVQTSLLNLQSLVLRHCSPDFLSHLLEHLPQLRQLSVELSTPWLPDKHPLMQRDSNRVFPIDKRLAPNLCHLKISWDNYFVLLEPINQLFGRDVFSSLTKFTLMAKVAGPHVVHDLLSLLSDQCLYVLAVRWSVQTVVLPSNTSNILSETFQQLKGRVPIELELSLDEDSYSITAFTLPRMQKCLNIQHYLHRSTVLGRSRWPYNVCTSNSRLVHWNKISMGSCRSPVTNEFGSYSPPIVPWHQITSLNINAPFNLAHLHLLFSQTINLRILEIDCMLYLNSVDDLKERNLIDLLNDDSLCNMLMSNGLQQLNLSFRWDPSNLIDIAHLIVERLSYLQAIELHCSSSQLLETVHILINGLAKLNFLTIHGGLQWDNCHNTKLHDSQNSSMRLHRTEAYDSLGDVNVLFVWL